MAEEEPSWPSSWASAAPTSPAPARRPRRRQQRPTAPETLPGIDDALATRIVELRAELNGFSSVHDLGGVLDLDGTPSSASGPVVFLPR